jgi:hypothetical protein
MFVWWDKIKNNGGKKPRQQKRVAFRQPPVTVRKPELLERFAIHPIVIFVYCFSFSQSKL